ncbi:MAG: hypothetical protein RR395_00945 [Ruthenibacterium sp.]
MSTNPNRQQDDFEELGKAIESEVRQTVAALGTALQGAIASVGKTVQQSAAQSAQKFSNSVKNASRPAHPYPPQQEKSRAEKDAGSGYGNFGSQIGRRFRVKNYAKKAKSAASDVGGLLFVAAILWTVSLVAIVSGSGIGGVIPGIIGVFFVCGAVGSYFKAKVLRRLATYMNILGGRTFCMLDEFAAATGKSVAFVRKDIQTQIANGKFEDVFLPPDGTRLFVSEMAYGLYMSAQPKETPAAPKAETKASKSQAAQQEDPILTEFKTFHAELHRQNELIADDAVSEQIGALEAHTKLLCVWLEKHPGKQDRVRRFTSYYLPTTVKLLNTYSEVDPHAGDGNTAANIQSDIVGILHTINTAFTALENGLMEDTALNVSAEISAMETMLAQDGLSESDF